MVKKYLSNKCLQITCSSQRHCVVSYLQVLLFLLSSVIDGLHSLLNFWVSTFQIFFVLYHMYFSLKSFAIAFCIIIVVCVYFCNNIKNCFINITDSCVCLLQHRLIFSWWAIFCIYFYISCISSQWEECSAYECI